MQPQTISEIYATNNAVRARLTEFVGGLSDEQTTQLAPGQTWTIAQFVEHLAIVDGGIVGICGKLLAAAAEAGETCTEIAQVSPEVMSKMVAAATIKVEAPDRVKPTGTVSVAASLARLDESRQAFDELKTKFETVASPEFTFPHPAFGAMSATEWLILSGGHIMRHIKQMEKIVGG